MMKETSEISKESFGRHDAQVYGEIISEDFVITNKQKVIAKNIVTGICPFQPCSHQYNNKLISKSLPRAESPQAKCY